MFETSKVDVLIVGGGPVGMTLATELLRHGLKIKIVDKSATTKQYSRAPVFWPRAQEALQLMGIHHLWDGTTVPLHRMNVNVYGRPAGVVTLDGCESSKPLPMLVGQDVTERLLESHLSQRGLEVERSTEICALSMYADGAKATLRSESDGVRQVEASWIVGCDGTDSFVRSQCGIAWNGRQLKGLMVPIADARAQWGLPDGDGDAYVALTEDGYLLAIPLPGVWRIIVATPDTTPEGAAPTTTLERVGELTSHSIKGPVKLSESRWVSVVRYGNFIAPTFRAGRALLAGDAAHSIAPLSGQGMNVGVQDAFDFAWKLAYVHKGWARDGLLDTFTADRLPVAQSLVRFTNRFFDHVLNPGIVQRALGRIVAPLALRQSWVRNKISGFYTGTSIRYPNSQLNDSNTTRHPRPGDFARDANVVTWSNWTTVRFFEVLDALKWSIVLFTGPVVESLAGQELLRAANRLQAKFGGHRINVVVVIGAASAAGLARESKDQSAWVLDVWRAMHGKYTAAASGGLVLIRPDGYVAMNRPLCLSAFDALESVLDRYLVVDQKQAPLTKDQTFDSEIQIVPVS